MRDGTIDVRQNAPGSRKGKSHTAETRRLISKKNLVRAWEKPGGMRSIELHLCRLCERLIMVSKDRLKDGRRGEFHKDCVNEWRHVLGRRRPEILGRAPRIKLPKPGKKGRRPSAEELHEHFRWLFLHRVGRLTLGDIAELVSGEEFHIRRSRSAIQYGSESIVRYLPPWRLASKRFRPYIRALHQAAVPIPSS